MIVDLEILTRGPATDAIPYIPPNIARNIGLLWRGTVCAIVTRAPVKIPALPNPAMARPIIKTVEDGATPQIKDPTSNTNNADRKTHLTLNNL